MCSERNETAFDLSMRLLKCWGGIVHTQNKQSIYKKIDQKSSAVPRTVRVVFIYRAGCPTAPAPVGHTPSSSSGILHPCATGLPCSCPCPCPGGVPYPGSSRSKEQETSSWEKMSQLNHALKKIPPQNENNYTGGDNSINLCWREPH